MNSTMRLREQLEREFALRFDELSLEMQICVERIEAETASQCSAATRLNTPTDDFPISIGLVLCDTQKERVFRLRHDSFVASGWIAPNEQHSLCDEFDHLPTSIIIEAVADGRTVGTLRIAVASTASDAPTLPCELEFPREVARMRTRHGPRIAEFSRVAIDPDIANTSFKTTLYGGLVRTAFTLAKAADIDYALVAVHERVSSFYRYMIGFEHLARAPSYGIIAEPTELLGCAGSKLFRKAALRSHFFHVPTSELERAHTLLQRSYPALAIPDRALVKARPAGRS